MKASYEETTPWTSIPVPKPPKGVLCLIEHGKRTHWFILNLPLTTIGRSRECDFRIGWQYEKVSRRHAQILRDNEGFTLHDGIEKQSSHGTFMNGERVGRDGIRLSDGDWIVLGGVSDGSTREALHGACTLLYTEGGTAMEFEQLINIQARAEALSNRLEEFDTQLERGYLEIGRYTRLKTDIEAQRIALLKELQIQLETMGMTDLQAALEEAGTNQSEQELKAYLKETAEEKGWGASILEQIDRHKGEIVSLIIAIALELGKKL